MLQSVDREFSPSLNAKKRASSPGLRGDHVRLLVVTRGLACRSHIPSAAKAVYFSNLTARLKPRPFKDLQTPKLRSADEPMALNTLKFQITNSSPSTPPSSSQNPRTGNANHADPARL